MQATCELLSDLSFSLEGLAVARSFVFTWRTCWAQRSRSRWEAFQSHMALCMTQLRWIISAQCQEITVIAQRPEGKLSASWYIAAFKCGEPFEYRYPTPPLPPPVPGSPLNPVKEGKMWPHVPYICLVQYYIVDDKNYLEFKERVGRFAKGCWAEGDHTDLRKPLSCARLAAAPYPEQVVGVFAFFVQEFTLAVAREALVPRWPLAWRGMAIPRKAVASQGKCELLGLMIVWLCLHMAALGGSWSLGHQEPL